MKSFCKHLTIIWAIMKSVAYVAPKTGPFNTFQIKFVKQNWKGRKRNVNKLHEIIHNQQRIRFLQFLFLFQWSAFEVALSFLSFYYMAKIAFEKKRISWLITFIISDFNRSMKKKRHFTIPQKRNFLIYFILSAHLYLCATLNIPVNSACVIGSSGVLNTETMLESSLLVYFKIIQNRSHADIVYIKKINTKHELKLNQTERQLRWQSSAFSVKTSHA